MKALIGCILIIGIWSCYKPKDGCLDPIATNFSPESDNPCCCTYPMFQFNLKLDWNGETFKYNKKYITNSGDSIAFNYIGLYLKSFYLTGKNQTYNNSETKAIRIEKNGVTSLENTSNDLLLITRNRSESYSFGTWKWANDSILNIRFSLGLGAKLTYAKDTTLTSDYPLSLTNKDMREELQQTFNSIVLKYDNNGSDSLGIELPQELMFDRKVKLNSVKGNNFSLTLTLDMAKLTNGVRFFLDSKNEMKEKILSNLENSIFVE